MKRRAWTAALLGTALALAQDDLPVRAPGNALDFEPKLMLDGPHARPVADSTPAMAPDDRVRQKQAALLQAEQGAAQSEQLYKEGVLAKVEAEGRQLHVVQLRKELADATLDAAAAHADAEKKSVAARAAGPAEMEAASAALKSARDEAAAASAAWDQAQVDAAALDLKRKRKLYAEGVATKREVEMAEDRVTLLSGTTAP